MARSKTLKTFVPITSKNSASDEQDVKMREVRVGFYRMNSKPEVRNKTV